MHTLNYNPVFIINTFKTILLPENEKPLVICDIDYTFIRPLHDYQYYKNIYKDHIATKELDNMITNLLHESLAFGLVKQTDPDGFVQLLEKIKILNGKLIFLTARSHYSHEKTIADLKRAGLENPNLFEIHYTNNEITKGEYIKKHKLLEGYSYHVFVDDYPDYLESARMLFPKIKCYLFSMTK